MPNDQKKFPAPVQDAYDRILKLLPISQDGVPAATVQLTDLEAFMDAVHETMIPKTQDQANPVFPDIPVDPWRCASCRTDYEKHMGKQYTPIGFVCGLCAPFILARSTASPEPQANKPAPPGEWTCAHCKENFTQEYIRWNSQEHGGICKACYDRENHPGQHDDLWICLQCGKKRKASELGNRLREGYNCTDCNTYMAQYQEVADV